MRPLLIFDLETTGTDIVLDKIVQFAAIKVVPETWEEIGEAKNVLINPGIPIPKAASDVHGITDEMVKEKPLFKAYSKSMAEYMAGCDYGGFNIKRFDVPFLAEEFATCGIDWPAKDAKYYDGLQVFHEKEKRDLQGAMRFYCNAEHTDAHDALADVRATKMVIGMQMVRYPDLRNPADYADFCHNPNAIDLAGKLELNAEGVPVYAFGKDKGKAITKHPGFGNWMLSNSFPSETKKILRKILFSK